MATYWKAPTANYFSTTLNGAIADDAETITLNSVTGLQAPGYIVVDREDGSGNATSSAREIITFTGVSGSDLTGCTRAADTSTARSHSDGALVESVMTVGTFNDLRDGVAAALNTDGTGLHVANATISEITSSTRIVSSSIASIARVEVGTLVADSSSLDDLDVATLSISSIASVSRAEVIHIEATTLSISSIASIAQSNLLEAESVGERMEHGNIQITAPGSGTSFVAVIPFATAFSSAPDVSVVPKNFTTAFSIYNVTSSTATLSVGIAKTSEFSAEGLQFYWIAVGS